MYQRTAVRSEKQAGIHPFYSHTHEDQHWGQMAIASGTEVVVHSHQNPCRSTDAESDRTRNRFVNPTAVYTLPES